ncbi:MAG: 3-deoxy-D-manno-octulosonic acid transferase [Flavobacteriaceae bacterium]|nr:3-deoxy-D-manno-octulosonic acid transferase [Flavobacteriaceae bacterium]
MIYSLFFEFCFVIVKILGLFVPKIKNFLESRKRISNDIRYFNSSKNNFVIWIHCSSMGEFEQIKPLLKKIKKSKPIAEFVITFFSESGFNSAKNFTDAKVVTYLPFDRKKEINQFINKIRPKALLLVKNEFWPNLIKYVQKSDIKIFSISSSFRKSQIFFNVFSFGMVNTLKKINFFFVVNENDKLLLETLNISNVKVTGDTRFDRVLENFNNCKNDKKIKKILKDSNNFVIGSSWIEDHKVLLNCCDNNTPLNWIIAPHKVDSKSITDLEKLIPIDYAKWSTFSFKTDLNKKVLIIDEIGVLSSLYKFSKFAYIGGGMGNKGLHNTLEAAVFGIPIIIGKNFKRFPEAFDMQKLGGVVSISTKKEFKNIWGELINSEKMCLEMGKINFDFIRNNVGSSERINFYIKKYLI